VHIKYQANPMQMQCNAMKEEVNIIVRAKAINNQQSMPTAQYNLLLLIPRKLKRELTDQLLLFPYAQWEQLIKLGRILLYYAIWKRQSYK
jgi:hypothetical protein